MGVFSKMRDFLGRHRGKIVVGSALVAGTIFLTKYAQNRLKEWQEGEARDFLERARKQQHFESTERTCNQTVVTLLASLNKTLSEIVDTEEIVAKLRTNPENKVELWEELKVLVFTKASCFIYMCVMFVVTMRIQLNIVGGYIYKDTTAVSTDVQQKYLLLCNNLFEDSLRTLIEVIKNEYLKMLKPITLKKMMKLQDFDNIFWAIQSTMAQNDANPIEHLADYVIPDGVPVERGVYADMVTDTADLLESNETKALVTHCVNRGFTLLSDQLSEYYMANIFESACPPMENGFVHPSEQSIPLAKLVPIINGLVSKGSLPDQLVRQLVANERLKTFGANVYECFSNAK